MSAVIVKKPWMWGQRTSQVLQEPFNPAAQWSEPLTAAAPLSSQEAVEGMFIILQDIMYTYAFTVFTKTSKKI